MHLSARQRRALRLMEIERFEHRPQACVPDVRPVPAGDPAGRARLDPPAGASLDPARDRAPLDPARDRVDDAARSPAAQAAEAPHARATALAGGTAQPAHVAGAAGVTAQPACDLPWDALEVAVAACEACELHRTRTQTVFGVGNRAADWLFIGEAPGAEEDRRGEPFVGRAGQLLNAMLTATGRERSAVYIANVLKCRPPRNRDPSQEEASRCAPWLNRQIRLIEPRVIIALGRIAAQRLLKTDAPLSRLRGRVHRYEPGDDAQASVPLIVTYHPAYLLRSPGEKRKAWEDLRLVMQVSP